VVVLLKRPIAKRKIIKRTINNKIDGYI